MDILTNKQTAKYDYRCRYTNIPYYFNTEDKKYIYGIGKNMSKETVYALHQVTWADTIESLALKYYNNPTLWWVIAYFNNIQDSFIRLMDHYKTLRIPSLSSLEFKDAR